MRRYALALAVAAAMLITAAPPSAASPTANAIIGSEEPCLDSSGGTMTTTIYGTGVHRRRAGWEQGNTTPVLMGFDANNPCGYVRYISFFTDDRQVDVAVLPGTPTVSVDAADLDAVGLLPLPLTGVAFSSNVGVTDPCLGGEPYGTPEFLLDASGVLTPANCS